MLTTILRAASGQVSGGPSGVPLHDFARMSAPISRPPARKLGEAVMPRPISACRPLMILPPARAAAAGLTTWLPTFRMVPPGAPFTLVPRTIPPARGRSKR
jgi:hypothetical protein